MKTKQREKGLKYATREGVFATLMVSLCNNFLSPFALALGATNVVIGLLSSVPSIFWTSAQIPAARLAEVVRDRKLLVFLTSLISRLFWLPILLLPFLSLSPLPVLIVLVTLSTSIGSLAGPAWASIMGHLVPGDKRGSYFSRRNYLCTAAGMIATFSAGWFLDLFSKGDFTGFVTIFSLGLLFGVLSSLSFHRIPRLKFEPVDEVNVFRDFRRISRNHKFRTFLKIYFLFQFGLMVAGPFFVVQLLENLKASYLWLSLLSVTTGLSTLMVLKKWGSLCDQFSHRSVIVLTSFGISLIPFLWLFASEPAHVIPINVLGGVMWGGFNLALFNYLLEISPSGRRPAYTAIFWTVVGLANIVAPLMGGYIADYFASYEYNLKILFFLSFAFRLTAAFLFWKFLEEPVKEIVPTKVILAQIRTGLTGPLMRFTRPYNHFISRLFGPEETE